MQPIKLYASQAGKWVHCPAFPRVNNEFKSPYDPQAAIEGTQSHNVAEWLINGSKGTMPEATPEGIACAKAYVNRLHPTVKAEVRLSLSIIGPNMGDAKVDGLVMYDDSVDIWDYKFGRTPVKAEGNWQLICYCIGVMEMYPCVNTFNTNIFQPRSNNADERHTQWVITKAEVVGYLDQLQRAARLAGQEDAKCSTGHHCLWCPGLHACPAAQEAAEIACNVSTERVTRVLTDYELSADITRLQEASDRLKLRLNGLYAEAAQRRRIPFYEMSPGRGKRVWKYKPEVIHELLSLEGLDMRKPLELKTPIQSSNLGLSDELFNELSESIPGAVKLRKVNGNVFKNYGVK